MSVQELQDLENELTRDIDAAIDVVRRLSAERVQIRIARLDALDNEIKMRARQMAV